MLHAIIMAGGTGTRFWPASTNDMPKQLLRLVGDATMLRQTVDRLGDLVPNARRLVVTNRRLVEVVQQQLPELPPAAIVGEPCKRDTAPCIGLAALLVSRHDPEATLAVMPADHVIRPVEKFQAALRQAAQLVDQWPGRIVLFGVKPTYPAEIFGYIHRGQPLASSRSDPPAPADHPLASSRSPAPAYLVKAFQEKPDAATARKYLESGQYYWNSGIFVWRATTILNELRVRQPDMVRRLEMIVTHWDTPERDAVFEQEFTDIEGTSIDYAVMDHVVTDSEVAVIEAPFEWDDLGGWQALARLQGADADGNAMVGRRLALATSGTIVRTDDDHLVVTLGVKDTIVVHTPRATLVANKQDEEKIRQVVKELEARGWTDYL